VQQKAQAVDALEAVLAVLDDFFLSEKDDEMLEAVGVRGSAGNSHSIIIFNNPINELSNLMLLT
jgi:hypothetical protein